MDGTRTIFEKIAMREIPGHIIRENDTCIAFLDIHPKTIGHTLVVPKVCRSDKLFDLSSEQYHILMEATYTVSQLLQKALSPKRILMHVEGWEVPHVHVHLLPVQEYISYETVLQKKAEYAMDEVAKKIHTLSLSS